MARIRTIKPEFHTDEKVMACCRDSRLLFIGMLNFADDEGRMVCSPLRIKAQIFPGDSCDVVPWLDELQRVGLITIYESSNAKIIQINGFTKHQKISKPRPSLLPADAAVTTFAERSLTTPGALPESPRPIREESEKNPQEWNGMEGIGLEGKGKEKPKPAGGLNSTAAAGWVMQNMGFIGVRMRQLCTEAVDAAAQEQHLDPERAAEFITARWEAYHKARDIPYKVSKFKFVEGCKFNERDEDWRQAPVTQKSSLDSIYGDK